MTVVAEYPGLAHGLIRPGDVLVSQRDERRDPTEWFVTPRRSTAFEARYEMRAIVR